MKRILPSGSTRGAQVLNTLSETEGHKPWTPLGVQNVAVQKREKFTWKGRIGGGKVPFLGG